MEHTKNIIQSQRSLEKEMVELGKVRYRRDIAVANEKKQVATTPAGLQLIGSSAKRVVNRLKLLKKKHDKGDALIYPYDAVAVLGMLPLDVMAFLALKVCVNYVSTTTPVQKVAMDIGTMIEDEFRIRNFKRMRPALLAILKRDLAKRTTNYRKQKNVLVHSANKAGIDTGKLPVGIKVKLGVMLIDILSAETGLFESVRTTVKVNRTPILFRGTAKALLWITKKNSICELLSPVKLPTVIPPKDWRGIHDGGYYDVPTTLVKSIDNNYLDQLEDLIKNGTMAPVLKAVNHLQKTPWRINKDVYNVMKYYVDHQIDVPVLPGVDDQVPHTPFPKEGTKEDIIDWKRAAGKLHEENVRRRTRRLQLSQLMWAAEKFNDYDKFYFPHTLDFRGRAYASSAFLNPQAEDTGRSLLEFSEGRILGQFGVDWLAVHGANCWGYDKVSLEERVEWVMEHGLDILAIASDPIEHTKWMDASKPWQFLAFCFDFKKLKSAGYKHHKSHIPVAIDGSCNGLQHFSAMLRDETGGRAVNLLPMPFPQDIYQIVADKTEEILPDNSIWKNNVTRQLTKRPTMTTPYGATIWGMRAQVKDEIRKQAEKGVVFPFSHDDVWPHANELAVYIYEAIGKTVVAAREAMTWLQAVAKTCNAQKVGSIYWSTPTGFLVKQGYLKPLKKQVRTMLNGKFAFLQLQFHTDNTDRSKQVQGIAPNFIHSMDSSHMMLTINKASALGINSFHMVHDSFGVHAGDVEKLAGIVKETFVEIYSKDILEDFRLQVMTQAKDIPETPKYGTLNLKNILDADYFFC